MASFQAARVARRGARELKEYRQSAARLRSTWTVIDGIAGPKRLRLHARRAGGAGSVLPPIVLVHGWGIASSYMVPLAARLSEHTCVFVPELPGHGLSDHDERPLAIPEQAAALVAWLDARQPGLVILVGHSLGCQIVAEVAVSRPDLTAGLVLIGPTSDPAARSVAAQAGRAAASVLFEAPTLVLLALIDYSRAGVRVLVQELRQMITHALEELLPAVTAPVRVIRGDRDRIVSAPWAETVARLAAAPAPVVVPGWSHAVQYSEPDTIARCVLMFARSFRERAD